MPRSKNAIPQHNRIHPHEWRAFAEALLGHKNAYTYAGIVDHMGAEMTRRMVNTRVNILS